MTKRLSSHLGGGNVPYFSSAIAEALKSKCIFYNDGQTPVDRTAHTINGVPTDVAQSTQLFGNGWVFDGLTSELNFGNAPFLDMDGTEKRSWSFWIVRKNNNNESIMSRGGNTLHTGIGWTIMTAGGNTVFFQLNAASGYPTDELQVNALIPVQDGVTREHIVITYAGDKVAGNVKFYHNGSLLSTVIGADNLVSAINDSSAEFLIGGCTETHCACDLDEIGIFNDELVQDEVNFLYATGQGATLHIVPPLGLQIDGDATPDYIATNKVAWINGYRVVGTNQKALEKELYTPTGDTFTIG